MPASAYRSLDPVLRERLAVVRERRERDALQIDAVANVVVRRVARAAAGSAAAAAALVVFVVSLGCFVDGPWAASADGRDALRAAATHALLGAWGIGVAAALAARVAARVIVGRILRADGFAPSGDAAADLARLESHDPLRRALGLASRWETASTALPLVGVSLLAPLTLHWLVAKGVGALSGGELSATDYGWWIMLSVLIVGHAHVVLAIFAARWARRVRRQELADIDLGLRRAWASTLGWTVVAACIPGILLVGVPPLLTVLTGMLFIPAMFHLAARSLVRERLALESAAS